MGDKGTVETEGVVKMTGTPTHPGLISLHGIGKRYQLAGQELSILNDVCLCIARGDSCGILGASGSGKSTLLNILGLLDLPNCGQYHFAGHDIFSASPDELAAIRNQQIGFVFQSFNLLPRLSALDNVALPLSYRGVSRHASVEQALRMLEQVGLAERAHHRPADLSGGQRQRVAIARALALSPKLIVCDEPVSALDLSTQARVLDLFLQIQRDTGVSYLFVSHDLDVVRHISHRVAVMYHGEIVEQGPAEIVTRDPEHPYTQRLLLASPVPDPDRQEQRRADRHRLLESQRHQIEQAGALA
jgi:putative ABC transport system ATP-binding protein